MRMIQSEEVDAVLSFPAFVYSLEAAFGGEFSMPPRSVFPLEEKGGDDAFALLPAWNDSLIGVKAFTYFPENAEPEYRSLYSQILLFDRKHGEPLALVDGGRVTYWRTAGVSALASRLLSRENSESLLLLGTGNLAPFLIRAHASVRSLKRVMIWGRYSEKAAGVVEALEGELDGISFSVVEDLEAACGEADVIVCATGSPEPLVCGDWVRPGTHTDFLGNHHATRRECDTELILKSRVYVDSRANCLKEGGEILVPMKEGAFSEEGLVGELAEMCRGSVPLRGSDEEVTLFKSVGTALGDLVGAGLVYEALAGA